MTAVFIYSILAGVVMTVLWLSFRLTGLHGLTHFRLNRALILGILLLSLGLPFIAFRPVAPFEPLDIIGPVEQPVEITVVSEPSGAVVEKGAHFDWSPLSTVYVAGVCIFALWMLVGVASVFAVVARGRKVSGGLIVHSRKISPFTWGRWIVVSEADAENVAVILHEQAHMRAMHWLDLLLGRATVCLLWYWPTSWLLNRDLQTVHEFDADRAVLDGGISPSRYQLLLVSAGSGRRYPNIVNPLNYYSLKQRITMMKKKSSSKRSCMRALALLPAVAALVLLVSTPVLSEVVSSHIPADAEPLKPLPARQTEAPVKGDSLSADEQNPLWVVDGEIVNVNLSERVLFKGDAAKELNAAIKELKGKAISEVTILKDAAATARYGLRGKNGVVYITTLEAQNQKPLQP